ncbi:CLIP domain-containing serine protease 14D-like isoform X1 [Drosophila miranda]|uniref:CLIP domain-containing serine protease 14D-like isoform X1 n=1 Tax=Drosophila miranda TaxID=7229 RepID=UPI0007E7B16F|nr:CLIP domain-containing serine protease 14D-like isoform X1 [Drosophila miranda]
MIQSIQSLLGRRPIHSSHNEMPGSRVFVFVNSIVLSVLAIAVVCEEEACGRLDERQLYTNKVYAEQDEQPWLGRLVYKNSSEAFIFHCVAVLLNARHALTPASCFYRNKKPHTPYAVLFDTSDCESSTHIKMFSIEKFIVHPDYNINTLGDDLAAIRLDRDVPFSIFAQPICMPQPWEGPTTFVATNVDLIGYDGQDGKKMHSRRIKTYANIRDKQFCKKSYELITEHQMCGHVEGADLQYGSALVGVRVENGVPKNYYLIGNLIGRFESYLEAPYLFMFIAPYSDWILDNIQAI